MEVVRVDGGEELLVGVYPVETLNNRGNSRDIFDCLKGLSGVKSVYYS